MAVTPRACAICFNSGGAAAKTCDAAPSYFYLFWKSFIFRKKAIHVVWQKQKKANQKAKKKAAKLRHSLKKAKRRIQKRKKMGQKKQTDEKKSKKSKKNAKKKKRKSKKNAKKGKKHTFSLMLLIMCFFFGVRLSFAFFCFFIEVACKRRHKPRPQVVDRRLVDGEEDGGAADGSAGKEGPADVAKPGRKRKQSRS